MNRRILDEVSVTAISKTNDSLIMKFMEEKYGASTLVTCPRTECARMNSSNVPLPVMSLSKALVNIKNPIKLKQYNHCVVIDSDNNEHMVNSDILQLLKAIFFYQCTCNKEVSICLAELMNEIDSYFKGVYNKASIVIVDVSGEVNGPEENPLKVYCRKEVFTLLRKYGVDIIE